MITKEQLNIWKNIDADKYGKVSFYKGYILEIISMALELVELKEKQDLQELEELIDKVGNCNTSSATQAVSHVDLFNRNPYKNKTNMTPLEANYTYLSEQNALLSEQLKRAEELIKLKDEALIEAKKALEYVIGTSVIWTEKAAICSKALNTITSLSPQQNGESK